MRKLRSPICLVLVIFTLTTFHVSAHAQVPEGELNRPASYTFATVGVGWGAPYGLGVEAGYSEGGIFDISLGGGFNMSGLKIGVGTRVYLLPSRDFSPFCGLNYVYSSGGSLSVTINEAATEYHVTPNNYLHAKCGGRVLINDSFGFLFGIGYRTALFSPTYEYVSGEISSSADDVAALFTGNGYEVSVKLLFKF